MLHNVFAELRRSVGLCLNVNDFDIKCVIGQRCFLSFKIFAVYVRVPFCLQGRAWAIFFNELSYSLGDKLLGKLFWNVGIKVIASVN